MNIVVDKTHESMSQSAADYMAKAILSKPDLTLLVATGNTPIESYHQLAKMASASSMDTSQIRVLQLDEYLGVGPDDPRSLYGWMNRDFLGPLRVSEDRVVSFESESSDPERAVASYDRMVTRLGGVDLAVLGLGPNGHLGFNEPPSTPDSPTRTVDLSPESLASNRNYWEDDAVVPQRAFTAGMTTILAARQILLLVSGAHKQNILQETISGPATGSVPASLLQTVSDKVTVFCDDAAWGDREDA